MNAAKQAVSDVGAHPPLPRAINIALTIGGFAIGAYSLLELFDDHLPQVLGLTLVITGLVSSAVGSVRDHRLKVESGVVRATGDTSQHVGGWWRNRSLPPIAPDPVFDDRLVLQFAAAMDAFDEARPEVVEDALDLEPIAAARARGVLGRAGYLDHADVPDARGLRLTLTDAGRAALRRHIAWLVQQDLGEGPELRRPVDLQ